MHFTDVQTNLPLNPKDVLIRLEDKTILMAQYQYPYGWFAYWHEGFGKVDETMRGRKVTGWMSLSLLENPAPVIII